MPAQVLDKPSIVIDKFEGIMNDNGSRKFPPGSFSTLDNIICHGRTLQSRAQVTVAKTIPEGTYWDTATGVRLRRFFHANGIRVLVGAYNAGYGTQLAVWDVDKTGGSPTVPACVPITDAAGALDARYSDFSAFTLGKRCYLTFYDPTVGTGMFGSPATGFYYYLDDGSVAPTALKAAGVRPGGAVAVADAVGTGNCEPGRHLVGVAYETYTGHVTKMTVYGPWNAGAGVNRVQGNWSNIPTGPAGTAKRHLYMSHVIRDWFGNPDPSAYEMFEIPGTQGIINDNITTTATVDVFDTQLAKSADYLLDLLEIIPMGTGFCSFSSRLVSWGEPVSATDLRCSSVVRISAPGLPESHSSVDGFLNVDPHVGGGVKCCFEQTGALYIMKDSRTYVSRDNGGPVNTWPVELVDASNGCFGPDGIASVCQCEDRVFAGNVLVQNMYGIKVFNGSFANVTLTEKLKNPFWNQYAKSFYVDTLVKKIYFNATIQGGPVGYQPIQVLDYSMGMDAESIRPSIIYFNNRSLIPTGVENYSMRTFMLIANSYDFSAKLLFYGPSAGHPGTPKLDYIWGTPVVGMTGYNVDNRPFMLMTLTGLLFNNLLDTQQIDYIRIKFAQVGIDFDIFLVNSTIVIPVLASDGEQIITLKTSDQSAGVGSASILFPDRGAGTSSGGFVIDSIVVYGENIRTGL